MEKEDNYLKYNFKRVREELLPDIVKYLQETIDVITQSDEVQNAKTPGNGFKCNLRHKWLIAAAITPLLLWSKLPLYLWPPGHFQ